MSGGFSRVSISDSLRRTIQDIKEITGKHSDEDVYAMLKDCNMDPNETAQKLLYLDTFHEVKRKRDRRKVVHKEYQNIEKLRRAKIEAVLHHIKVVNNRAHEEYWRTPGMQRRGTRGDRVLSVARGGPQSNARHDNGYSSSTGRAIKPSNPVLHKIENDAAPAVASSTAPANGLASLSNGSSNHEMTTQLAKRNIRDAINIKSSKTPYLPNVMVKQFLTSNPGPTPAPTPTNTTVATGSRFEGGNLKLKSSHLAHVVSSPFVSGLYSSASDPVLVPSLNPRNSGAVGIIKRETGNQRNIAESSTNPLADRRMNVVQNVIAGQSVSEPVDLTSNRQSLKHQGVERSQLIESSQLPSSTHHHNAAANGNQETCTVRQINNLSKEMLSGAAGVTSEANLHSLPAPGDPSYNKATSEVDDKLHKLHISARQSVIFPNHLHVPEAYKNALTFGSLDAPLGQSDKDSNPRDVSVPTNADTAKEPSLIHQSTSSAAGHSDYPDLPQSPPHVPVNSIPSQEHTSSGIHQRFDQAKQETYRPVGGSHTPIFTPMPDYGPSLGPPPVVGSHLVQLEGLDPQGANSVISLTGSTPSVTQPTGMAQSSIAVSPQLFPFLRHPYPPNYIPYSPYLSQLYMPPQNAHQLLSHSGFPQQPSAGNIYMPPSAAAAPGVKFPITPLYKPGNFAGNLTHYGISSSYGSYGASGVGYSSSNAFTPGTSASNDDIAGSELKEKNVRSMINQVHQVGTSPVGISQYADNENLPVYTSGFGRDILTFQPNVFYNLPQGQPVGFSPAQVGHNSFGGIYHPSPSMSTPSLVQSVQPPGGTIESVVPPLTSYSQPQLRPQTHHGQMNLNEKLVNGENI